MADTERLYIKNDGSHGLILLEDAYNSTVMNLSEYFKQGKFTRLIREHVVGRIMYSL